MAPIPVANTVDIRAPSNRRRRQTQSVMRGGVLLRARAASICRGFALAELAESRLSGAMV